MILLHPAGILSQGHIEVPVQAVFHAPMVAHGLRQFLGGQWARADVVPPMMGWER